MARIDARASVVVRGAKDAPSSGKAGGACKGIRSDAFMEHAMDAWGNSVYLVALSQTQSVADAQDVSQDVFVRLLQSDTEFADDEHLKAWLLRVCVNRCRELHRSAWRRRVESVGERDECTASSDATEDEALARLRANPVWQALESLPDKLRIVAHLHYVEEYPTDEIARLVGCRPATVRSRLHRAREWMRRQLESEEGNHGTAFD